MIRIGANPIGWSNDDMPELGGATPLETCLAEAKEIGFAGMELGNKFPREPAALKAALAPYGLACVSGWYSGHVLGQDVDAEMAAIRPHLDLLKAMGSPVLIYAEATGDVHSDRAQPLSRRPVIRDGQWRDYGRRMTDLSRRVLDEGVRVVFHHHMGMAVQSESDVDRLMEATGEAMHLLLDTGHAVWGGCDPAALARRYRGRISHVHAKDVRRAVMERSNRENWSFLDAVVAGVYTVPGDGMVDFPAVFRELKGYSGWVIVEAEQDPEKANPYAYAKMGYDNLTRYLRTAGLIAETA
jgi:myo-inosose-2 dehydratase